MLRKIKWIKGDTTPTPKNKMAETNMHMQSRTWDKNLDQLQIVRTTPTALCTRERGNGKWINPINNSVVIFILKNVTLIIRRLVIMIWSISVIFIYHFQP